MDSLKYGALAILVPVGALVSDGVNAPIKNTTLHADRDTPATVCSMDLSKTEIH